MNSALKIQTDVVGWSFCSFFKQRKLGSPRGEAPCAYIPGFQIWKCRSALRWELYIDATYSKEQLALRPPCYA